MTLIDDVPLDLKVEDCGTREPNREAALALFREMEFSRLIQEVAGPAKKSQRPREYRLVSTGGELAELAELLASSGGFAVDLETTHLEPMRAEIVGLSFSAREDTAFYVPVGHDYLGAPEQLPLETVLKALGPVLTDPALPKYGQNIKYDALVFQGAGLTLAGIDFDTMVASYVINPTRHRHNLTELALEYLDEKVSSYEDVAGKGKKQIPFSHVEVAAALEYAGEDADVTFRLTGTLRPKIEELSLGELYYGLELPLVQVLAAMERNGVLIDMQALRDLAKEVDGQLQELVRKIWTMAGVEFNLNSPKQLAEILFDRLGLPVVKKTKTGPSTDESVLSQLAEEGHQVPRLILEYRELDKLDSTYVRKLPTMVNPETGRIHTSFNQTVAATGRLSSSDPNLQNIPIRSALGREIRKGFIPAEGCLFVSADYSQIELRVLAHLSGDPVFVEAFRGSGDIHRETAARIFGVAPEKVNSAMRDRAKTINFGLIYGQGGSALARQLGISRTEADEFIQAYFERFAGVRDYLETMKETAREKGYVETLLGRRRYIPEIRSRNPGVRGFGERTATNSPIQGTAADLIKLAMIHLHDRLGDGPIRMLLQVHDELLFEVPEDEVDDAIRIVTEEMEGAIELSVPLRVDVGSGVSWYDTKGG